MLNGAAWSLADLVDDGTVTKKAAEEMLGSLFEQMMARAPATERRRKAGVSARPGRRKNPKKERTP
jgi:hypothetical protein